MGSEQNKLIMSSFIKSQFSYCPLITNKYDSNFNELLESSHELSIHKPCIIYLMIKVFKYLHGHSSELMTDVFTLRRKTLTIFAIFIFLTLRIHGQCVLEFMQ